MHNWQNAPVTLFWSKHIFLLRLWSRLLGNNTSICNVSVITACTYGLHLQENKTTHCAHMPIWTGVCERISLWRCFNHQKEERRSLPPPRCFTTNCIKLHNYDTEDAKTTWTIISSKRKLAAWVLKKFPHVQCFAIPRFLPRDVLLVEAWSADSSLGSLGQSQNLCFATITVIAIVYQFLCDPVLTCRCLNSISKFDNPPQVVL